MNHKSNIFLICGSGGVGKTTISASLGLKFALEGKKTIVLTIDPAKRLATSLGIKDITDEPKKLNLPKKKDKGEMWAMMLDTKRTFDRLVEKYAPNPETKQKILGNKLYQHMSEMLSGTQEYMAMERLYEIYQSQDYEVIIVDTPPMQNAKDFLSAPQKMMNMIENSMLHLLLKPTLSLGKSGLKFFEKGSQQILKIFDRITGFAFLQDISEMLLAFKGLLAGFQSRASDVTELLKQTSTNFVIVVTTNDHSISEAQEFYSQLKLSQFNLGSIIVNRVYDGPMLSKAALENSIDLLKQHFASDEAELLFSNYNKFLPLIKMDQQQIKKMVEIMGNSHLDTIPLFLSDVHDMDSLFKVSQKLSLSVISD